MKREDNITIWVVTGIVGAVLLGIVLIPLRGFTSASNLAFVFLLWVLLIAELGGRVAAVAAAVLSAISLNFFLTQPYLSLTIEDRDDIIAFVAMLILGLIAASFGKHRKRWQDEAERSSHDLDVLETTAKHIALGTPSAEVLAGLRSAFRLNGIAIHDVSGKRVASAPSNFNDQAPPVKLEINELFSAGETELKMGSRGFLLPPSGRLEIPSEGGTVAVDFWGGDPEGYSLSERQALVVAALLMARSIDRK